MLLAERLASINSQIGNYEVEINRLNQLILELKSHAQEVQGAEAACESALAQIDTALSMLEAIAPDEIAKFKAAIDAKFSSPPAQLPPAPTPQPEPSPEPQPTPAPEDAIEVEVVADEPELETPEAIGTEIPETAPQSPDASTNDNGNGHKPLTQSELMKLKKDTLIALAEVNGINSTGRNKDSLARQLAKANIAQAEIEIAIDEYQQRVQLSKTA